MPSFILRFSVPPVRGLSPLILVMRGQKGPDDRGFRTERETTSNFTTIGSLQRLTDRDLHILLRSVTDRPLAL